VHRGVDDHRLPLDADPASQALTLPLDMGGVSTHGFAKTVKRFLVIFRSHPSPPFDSTVVDVSARCALSAVLAAKREIAVQHGWTLAQGIPWPRGCEDVDDAAAKIAAR
jgi:hypothetical protein